MENKKANTLWQRRLEPVLVVLARLVVGATFAFSGFVKSIDPAGTSLKIREYLEAFDLDFALPIAFFIAVCLGVYELILGVNLLFGSYRRVTSVLLFLAAFTFRRRAVDRWEGILFLLLYGGYLWLLIK